MNFYLFQFDNLVQGRGDFKEILENLSKSKKACLSQLNNEDRKNESKLLSCSAKGLEFQKYINQMKSNLILDTYESCISKERFKVKEVIKYRIFQNEYQEKLNEGKILDCINEKIYSETDDSITNIVNKGKSLISY